MKILECERLRAELEGALDAAVTYREYMLRYYGRKVKRATQDLSDRLEAADELLRKHGRLK
jgi:hypothetical protein